MIPQSARLFEVRGAVENTANSQARWTERRGLLLQVRDREGRIGLGEASPLPGYSPDGLSDVRRRLASWAAGLGSLGPIRDLDDVRRSLAAVPASLPSARFAIETALLDLLGQIRGMPIHELLSSQNSSLEGADGRGRLRVGEKLPLCGLVSGLDSDQAIDNLRAAWEVGLRTVKVKVGREDRFDTEMQLLERLRQAFGEDLRLRLDANGSLPVQGIGSIFDRYASIDPEWLEEPVASADWQGLPSPPDNVLLALDESLAKADCWPRLRPEVRRLGIGAMVLKPLTLGGILRCQDLAQEARAEGLATTASHGFDGPVALQAAAHLAVALAKSAPSSKTTIPGSPHGKPPAAGLARHGGLQAWQALWGEASATSTNPGRTSEDWPGPTLATGDSWLTPPTAPGLGLSPPPATAEGSDHPSLREVGVS